MSITKCPGHMRSLKLDFFSDCLNFGLESENFRKFKALLSKSFRGNCARAPRLTAVSLSTISSYSPVLISSCLGSTREQTNK